MSQPFLLYGSYGYTGSLIADLAVQHELQPILSGRDNARLVKQADRLGVKYRALSVDDPRALDVAVSEVPLVLNCAGPFSRTYQPMVEACLRAGRHYLDITGEIPVFEALAAKDHDAREAGVMLLPGVGFDVVPSDCLASHLKRRLPDATQLTIAILGLGGGSSRGTMLTSIEHLAEGGVVRRDGKLLRVPLLGQVSMFDFGRGPRAALNIPWGDVSTAYYSTGIPNIETYMVFSKRMWRMVPILRLFVGLSGWPVVKRLFRWMALQSPPGPSEEQLRTGLSRLIGIASNPAGQQVISRLETPNGYQLTAETAVAIVERVLKGELKPGFQTPSLAYGADFILEFEGVKREDL
ncbi:MAG: saccharopine dehydrogenase [Anaerolineales bacterium]|nr:saccharopine dehydrogenase [Anaerolineae bacterium]PWB55823.1 MAG: saccharopine dehydrogenase [Anaerolineales bacterium]